MSQDYIRDYITQYNDIEKFIHLIQQVQVYTTRGYADTAFMMKKVLYWIEVYIPGSHKLFSLTEKNSITEAAMYTYSLYYSHSFSKLTKKNIKLFIFLYISKMLLN